MPGEGPTAVCNEELLERREKEMRYKKWLEQVTVNAVEQALRIQLDESQRQPETGESHDSQTYSSANALPSLPPIRTHCIPKTWSLDRNSEERRTVAARIYSLLVLWKPDMSFEWRARVASAVHIFERALYQEAKTKEEYLNPLMLDLQLRQILRHFEAGTGSALLSKTTSGGRSSSALTKSVSFNSGIIEARRRPIALGDLMKMHDAGLEETRVRPRPGTIHETIHEDEVASRENLVADPSEPLEQRREGLDNTQRSSLQREEADGALWEAILCGNWKDMQESLNKHSGHASKRIVKRVMVLMTKRKQEEVKKVELELRNAMNESSSEKLAGVLWEARSEFREELKPLINDAATVLERLMRERRLDTSGEPSSSAPLPGRVVESRRVPENRDSESTARSGTSPPLERRQNPRLGRSVTFSFHETGQSRAASGTSNGLRPESTSRVDQSRASDPDRSTLSSALPERNPDLRYGQSLTSAMRIQRRERRLLGSLLEEAREDQRWSPSRTAVPAVQDSSSASSRDLYVGDRNGANTVAQNDSSDINQSSEPSTALVESSSLSSSDGPRMSLISLLHQDGDPEATILLNRRRLSLGMRTDSSKLVEELSEEMVDGGMDPICCVCMVGKKGAAFIPCGHTFCRKCTRELRKGRGTCPLCNRKIQDVLKIY
ncbi:hypothetical protein R1flu_020616 [Riccia fluitans]|uniref:RING-type domain-containing protein n=1 Tax=Riccia fluitans TaxID=41844 RepID=A0ABD1ZM86_9MARC